MTKYLEVLQQNKAITQSAGNSNPRDIPCIRACVYIAKEMRS